MANWLQDEAGRSRREFLELQHVLVSYGDRAQSRTVLGGGGFSQELAVGRASCQLRYGNVSLYVSCDRSEIQNEPSVNRSMSDVRSEIRG